MQDCCKSKREESMELIPEALKNMLLVLASQDILTPNWRVRTLSDALAPPQCHGMTALCCWATSAAENGSQLHVHVAADQGRTQGQSGSCVMPCDFTGSWLKHPALSTSSAAGWLAQARHQ